MSLFDILIVLPESSFRPLSFATWSGVLNFRDLPVSAWCQRALRCLCGEHGCSPAVCAAVPMTMRPSFQPLTGSADDVRSGMPYARRWSRGVLSRRVPPSLMLRSRLVPGGNSGTYRPTRSLIGASATHDYKRGSFRLAE